MCVYVRACVKATVEDKVEEKRRALSSHTHTLTLSLSLSLFLFRWDIPKAEKQSEEEEKSCPLVLTQA